MKKEKEPKNADTMSTRKADEMLWYEMEWVIVPSKL